MVSYLERKVRKNWLPIGLSRISAHQPQIRIDCLLVATGVNRSPLAVHDNMPVMMAERLSLLMLTVYAVGGNGRKMDAMKAQIEQG